MNEADAVHEFLTGLMAILVWRDGYKVDVQWLGDESFGFVAVYVHAKDFHISRRILATEIQSWSMGPRSFGAIVGRRLVIELSRHGA